MMGWTIPNADFDTIQAAVDAASDGDEVLVHPGTYTECEYRKAHLDPQCGWP